jgi:hypothetical protein
VPTRSRGHPRLTVRAVDRNWQSILREDVDRDEHEPIASAIGRMFVIVGQLLGDDQYETVRNALYSGSGRSKGGTDEKGILAPERVVVYLSSQMAG